MEDLTNDEWAYLAGFFDGDGCVSIAKSQTTISPTYALTVIFTQADGPFLEYWQRRTGLGNVYERSLKSNRSPRHPGFQWRMSHKDSIKFLKKIFGHVALKKDQVQLALEFAKLPSACWGSKGVPPRITQKREEYKQALSKLKSMPFNGLSRIELEKLDCEPETDQLRLR